jgi:hypothetical protein
MTARVAADDERDGAIASSHPAASLAYIRRAMIMLARKRQNSECPVARIDRLRVARSLLAIVE